KEDLGRSRGVDGEEGHVPALDGVEYLAGRIEVCELEGGAESVGQLAREGRRHAARFTAGRVSLDEDRIAVIERGNQAAIASQIRDDGGVDGGEDRNFRR